MANQDRYIEFTGQTPSGGEITIGYFESMLKWRDADRRVDPRKKREAIDRKALEMREQARLDGAVQTVRISVADTGEVLWSR
jgi:hypothetical protein